MMAGGGALTRWRVAGSMPSRAAALEVIATRCGTGVLFGLVFRKPVTCIATLCCSHGNVPWMVQTLIRRVADSRRTEAASHRGVILPIIQANRVGNLQHQPIQFPVSIAMSGISSWLPLHERTGGSKKWHVEPKPSPRDLGTAPAMPGGLYRLGRARRAAPTTVRLVGRTGPAGVIANGDSQA